MKKYYIVFVFLLLVGVFLRLYNFKNRLIFGPEQAISLTTSADNLEHFSLLGETNLIRKTSTGHIPFPDATFGYLLLPLILLFKFDPLAITFCFALLNLATGVILAVLVKKVFGPITSIFTFAFFMTSAVMIHHSLFIWIVNPTPLLAILSTYLCYVLFSKKNTERLKIILLLGTLSGLGFGMQKMYILFLIGTFLYIIYVSEKRVFNSLIFIGGVLLGNLPTLIFDIRHNFYHLITFLEYFGDVINKRVSGATTYYNYLYLYPLLFLFFGVVTTVIYKKSKLVALLTIFLYVFINLNSAMVNFERSTGMAKNITLESLKLASKKISTSNPPQKFNVATLWDFDTRALPMRYLLKYMYASVAEPVENYKDIDALYVLATDNYDIDHPKVWELQEFLPYKVNTLDNFAVGYKLYYLQK